MKDLTDTFADESQADRKYTAYSRKVKPEEVHARLY